MTAATCGRSYSNFTGIITSPNYPGVYDNNHHCVYQIRPHGANSIDITITNLNLEMIKDYLYIASGYVADMNQANESLTGDLTAMLPRTVTYHSGAVWLLFISDFSVVSSGFRIEYSAGE